MHFFPQTINFFNQFNQLASTTHQASLHLSRLKLGHSTTPKIVKAVQRLELLGDDLTHSLIHDADRSFITPIDREDIYALAKNFNSVLDHIENVTTGISLLNIKGNGQAFYQYVKLIKSSTNYLVKLTDDLSHKGTHLTRMKSTIASLHKLEKTGDSLTRTSLAHLFLKQKNVLTILKWKHIYDNLENTLDSCETVADTIDDIIIKNF